jgi:hypothetical protein
MWKIFTIGLIYFALFLIACPSWAAHSLIQGYGETGLLNGN